MGSSTWISTLLGHHGKRGTSCSVLGLKTLHPKGNLTSPLVRFLALSTAFL